MEMTDNADMPDTTALPALQWDIFCTVIDNYGDAGVCWRLASQLAGRGQRVEVAGRALGGAALAVRHDDRHPRADQVAEEDRW